MTTLPLLLQQICTFGASSPDREGPDVRGFRVHQGDDLILSIASNLALAGVQASAQVIGDDGEDYELKIPELTTASDRAFENFPSQIKSPVSGFINESYIGHAGSGRRGQTYANLQLRRGGRFVGELSKGYLYAAHGLSLGEYEEPGPPGHGFTRSIDLGDPDADTDYTTQTVPAGALWRLRGFAGILVQGATQNPIPTIEFTDGTTILQQLAAKNPQGASLTVGWSIAEGSYITGGSANIGGKHGAISGSYDMLLPAGFEITFPTVDKGANTNWGSGQILVEEWVGT